MRRIFFDLEMNMIPKRNWGQARQLRREIIEIGAVMLDESNAETASFKRFVKPQFAERIAPKIAELTAITDADVADAAGFADVFAEFTAWCVREAADGRTGAAKDMPGETGADPAFEIYAWSDSDLKQIRTELRAKDVALSAEAETVLANWRDFQRVYSDMFYLSQVMSLTKALELSGLDFSGRAHDGLTDARNTADLYRQTQDSEQFARLKALIDEMQRPHTNTLGSLVDLSGFDLPE